MINFLNNIQDRTVKDTLRKKAVSKVMISYFNKESITTPYAYYPYLFGWGKLNFRDIQFVRDIAKAYEKN